MKERLKNCFLDLNFVDETHTYSVGGQVLTPTSNMIKNFYEPFDTVRIATKKGKREGIDPQIFIDEWARYAKERADFGTDVHNFGEEYSITRYFTFLNSPLPSNGHERSAVQYWNDLPSYIIPVSFELQMYSIKKGYAGTADIMLYNTRTNKLIIADYKTNKDLFKNFRGKRMYAPYKHLLDMPYNHYALQLSFYQILLEEYGFEIEDRIIVYLTDNGYKLYKLKDYTNSLRKVHKW